MGDIDPQSRKEFIAYWEIRLEQATRAKEYAERMLGKFAIQVEETKEDSDE